MKNSSTQKQLLAYSAIATALLAANKGDAQVVYTDVDPNYVLDLSQYPYSTLDYYLDLDNNGVSDLLVQNWYASTRYTYWAGLYWLQDPASNAIEGTNANSAYHAPIALVLDSGAAINGDDEWKVNAVRLLYYDHRWLDQTNRYFGVRFQKSDGTHYGWVRLTVSETGNKIFVKDYAYEMLPNTPINAGQKNPCGDGFEPNNSFLSAKLIQANLGYHPLISNAGDVDFFKYHVTLPNMRITLTGLPANYNIKLYNSSYHLIGVAAKQGLHRDTIIANNITSGDYFIKIFGVNGSFDAANCYTFKVEASSSPFRIAAASDVLSNDDEIVLYPSPAQDKLTVKISSSTEIDQMIIYDALGNVVRELSFAGDVPINLDVHDLPAGIYLVAARTSKDLVLKKFIKQ